MTLPLRKQRPNQRVDDVDAPVENRFSANFASHYLETEFDEERVGLTLWDSEGLEKNMADLQLREIQAFLESKFEETLSEEIKVVRTPGAKDTHIHCVILLLDPINLNQTLKAARKAREAGYNGNFANGKSYLRETSPETLSGLDDHLDLQVLRALQGRTTVIPVISKADTTTVEHLNILKRAVSISLKAAKYDPFESLGFEEGDEDDEDDDSEAIADDEEETDANATPRNKKNQHFRHDSKRFDEADEDNMAERQASNMLQPETSHLDTASSSSGSSFNVTNPPQQTPRSANQHKSSSQSLLISGSSTSGSTPRIPFSVLTPEPMITPHQAMPGQTGRKFAWGFADPYNPEHCDFVRLRNALFKEWFSEMREASREIWYEEWRASRLNVSHSRTRNQNRSQPTQQMGTTTRQGMVPVAMLGNNSLSAARMGVTSVSSQRIPSGGASSARASPHPQTVMIPVTDLDRDSGEVGVAR